MTLLAALAWTGLPAAAQTANDARAVAEWNRTADRAEAMLELPLAHRARITIGQWEQLRLDLTIQRGLALALGQRGTLGGRIAEAQLAEVDAALPKGQAEPDWGRQKRGELNRRIGLEEGLGGAARDIEARDRVLIGEIDKVLHQLRRRRLFSHAHPVFAARTWSAAAGDLRSARIALPAQAIRQPYPELVGVPLSLRLALVAAIGAAAWFAARCSRSVRQAIDLRSVASRSPRSILGLAFARDLLDIALPAGLLLGVLGLVSLLAADLPFLAALSGELILAGLTIIFFRWLGQSIFDPAFAPARLVRLPAGAEGAAIRLMPLLGLMLAADQIAEYVDRQPGTSAAAGALVASLIGVLTGFFTWRLARVLESATGTVTTPDQDGPTQASARRLTDMILPAARIMTVAGLFGVAAALAGYVALARELLTATLLSFAAGCTTLFLYHSLTEASELLFHRGENPGSRYLQLLPLAFGFVLVVLFVLTLPIVAIIWGVSPERIVDGVLALKNGVAVGQIQVSFGSVMTSTLVFLLGYALTRATFGCTMPKLKLRDALVFKVQALRKTGHMRYRTACLIAGIAFALAAAPASAQGARASSATEFARMAERLAPGEWVWAPAVAPNGQVLVYVDLSRQLATVYRNGVRIGVSSLSSGKSGHETPTGVFTILQKHANHRSSTYNNAPMPFQERLTWDGVALHAGGLPGYPESHGCVHLPLGFSRDLFGIPSIGAMVVINGDAASHVRTSDASLLAPFDATGRPAGPEALGRQQFVWNPDRAPTGPMTIIVSKSDQRVVVMRGGVEIGRSVAAMRDDDAGSHVVTLTMADRGVPRWVYVGLPGHEEEAGRPLDESVINRLHLPRPFYEAVRAALRPGTTILITQSPVGTSPGEPLTVMDAVVTVAHAQSTGLEDMVGARAGQAELERRGYANVGGQQGDDRTYTYWWNPDRRQCVSIATMNGRYDSIQPTTPPDCGMPAHLRPNPAYGAQPATQPPPGYQPDPEYGRQPDRPVVNGQNVDLGLVCFGDGSRSGIATGTTWSWNRDRGRYETGTYSESQRETFDASLTVQTWAGGGRIRLPRSLIPPLNTRGNDGWWDLTDVAMSPERITASYRLNGLNKPRVTIDRRSGRITITGMADYGFRGTCDTIDHEPQRF